MSSTRAFFVLAIVCAAVIVIALLEGKAPLEPTPAPQVDAVAESRRPPPPERVPAEPVPTPADGGTTALRSARSHLAEFWGERWSELELTLEKQGLDLDQPLAIEPWEDVAPHIRERVLRDEAERKVTRDLLLKWPSDLRTPEGVAALNAGLELPHVIEFDESDVRAIESESAPYNDRLDVLAAEYNTRLEGHLSSAWQRGDFVRAPLTTKGLPLEPGFYSSAMAMGGWAISIQLRTEDCADLLTLQEEAGGIRRQRDEAVRGYLAISGRGGR